jgi:hypothetical protein
VKYHASLLRSQQLFRVGCVNLNSLLRAGLNTPVRACFIPCLRGAALATLLLNNMLIFQHLPVGLLDK